MQDIDFHRPQARTAWWAWALLAAALLSLAAAADELWTQHRQGDERAAERDRLASAVERRTAALRGPMPSARPAGRDDKPQRKKLPWSTDLHRPWLELLDALERCATPQVPLQQIAVDARFDGAQLQVQAASLPELFAYVTALQRAGAPIRAAQLAGHEWTGAEAAEGRRLRARIVLRLDAGPLPAAARELP
jgi:hypothetical protein